jgi:hypothetical protein
LQNAYNAVRDFQVASSSSSGVMEDFIYKTLGIKNLAEMTMNRQDDLILERIYLAAQQMHIGGVAVYDSEGEALQKQGTPVTGLADLWDRSGDIACAAFDMPRSRFFSNETGSLGGTSAEMDLRIYYDGISSKQEIQLRPWENEFIKNVSLVEFNKESDVSYEFNPLMVPTSKEMTDERFVQSQTDVNYANVLQAASPVEIAKSRWRGPKPDLVAMNVDFEEREKQQEEASEEQQNQMAEILAGLKNKKEPEPVKKEEKTDAQPIIVKPEIRIDAPVYVKTPEQKDNSKEQAELIQREFAEMKAKLEESQEIEIVD